MWLLSCAVLLGLLKVLAHLDVADVANISALSWWWVIGAFAASAAWFAYADSSGLTSRKAMERMDARKQTRIEQQREALGMRPKRKR